MFLATQVVSTPSPNSEMLFIYTRYQQLGRFEDLEYAITYHREALTLCAPGHPDRSSSLNNLGIAVCTRYRQLGRIEDLEDEITYHREALVLHPRGHPNRFHVPQQPCKCHYVLLEGMEDLEESFALCK